MKALLYFFQKKFHSIWEAPLPECADHAFIVDIAYKYLLGRSPDPTGREAHIRSLRHGTPVSRLFQHIALSEEARGRGMPSLSDGEFISCVGELLFPAQGATPKDIEKWQRFLREEPGARLAFVWDRFREAHVALQLHEEEPLHDTSNIWIMGTDRFLTSEIWQQRVEEAAASGKIGIPEHRETELNERGPFYHTGDYIVSAIASLYRGKRFIRRFLENMISQTIFDRSELIIIDADSPEGEAEIIVEYQQRYPNIVYKRINYRIGIYDAWNIGIGLSRGRYLTNVNLDDLRRNDSFELQSAGLDRHQFVDVMYQDFFYTFDSDLDFEKVATLGFKSALPIVTPHNLLAFNSPHNAPMWRRTLHDELGLFDTSFISAGDYEFWMRCISRGKTFFKSNVPHVVYFHNPEGISTRPDTKGIEEARRILRRYSRKLLSKYLTMSKNQFADELGVPPEWGWDTSYYDVVQRQLRLLGDGRAVNESALRIHTNGNG